jgi:hypothetical protein
MKQEIEIVNLEIKEFIEEEVANITITLLVDKNSHYWDSCNKLCKVGVRVKTLFYFEEGYFIYCETVNINSATKGILNYLQDLSKSCENTVISCNILRAIKALDLFWD